MNTNPSCALHMGQGNVSIHLSPFRSSLGTTCFHQDPHTSGGAAAHERGEVCDLSGRSTNHGSRQRSGNPTVCSSDKIVRILRVSRELPKVTDFLGLEIDSMKVELILPGRKIQATARKLIRQT